ncbi:Uncharacterized protein SVXHr_0779 [Halorhabdus sp. SVX81]|uniref:hypothetical protein n=1 Tax=Halorhabdus sp. SVX81 TaxID=2978283 RepID=UPI0023DBC256|nr:hypothetical protein [Halorhabdus sp. SVX81]WEL16958.1 Uncharacterized protein SVXHr_0779 [Halorhabdus sp. SVX81]
MSKTSSNTDRLGLDVVKSHAGETLQAIVIYDETRHRDVYRREDVESRHGSDLVTDVLEDIRSDRRRRRVRTPAAPG